jgi:glycerophosphoryl diester phosphodiesterase
MRATRRQVLSLASIAMLAPRAALAEPRPPSIFAEFGARPPDRTDYDQAIDRGADFLVAPVVAAKDGEIVVAPAIELSGFTDVATRAAFADRRRQAVIDGESVSGWLATDFTGPELRSLVTGAAGPGRGRSPPTPPTLMGLQEVTDIARAGSIRRARVVGLCPRLVHPAFFNAQDIALESRLAALIRLAGYNSPVAAMIVLSREPAALKALSAQSSVRRIQEIGAEGGPADPDAPRFQAMVGPDGLNTVRGWASAIAPDESLVVQPAAKGAYVVSDLVAAARAARLQVFARAPGPRANGNFHAGLTALFLAGVDGVMCEDVGQAARARGAAMDRLRPGD